MFISPPRFNPPNGLGCCWDEDDEVDWFVCTGGCPVSAESNPEIDPDPRLNVWLKTWGWLVVFGY